MNFLLQLEKSGFISWVREGGSLWGYPAVLFLHTIGLATVAGVNAGIDLRVLGFAPKLPLASLTRLFPVIWIAFAVTAVSGITLLLTDAANKLAAPVFYVKMVFVALAVLNVHLLKTRVFGDSLVESNALSTSAKVLALTSLIWWIAATTAGRLMAYIQ